MKKKNEFAYRYNAAREILESTFTESIGVPSENDEVLFVALKFCYYQIKDILMPTNKYYNPILGKTLPFDIDLETYWFVFRDISIIASQDEAYIERAKEYGLPDLNPEGEYRTCDGMILFGYICSMMSFLDKQLWGLIECSFRYGFIFSRLMRAYHM